MIVAKSLGKRYQKAREFAIRDVDFHVKKGECVAFLGPNGAGKTTLIQMLAGIIRPSEGAYYVTGLKKENPEGRRMIGYLPEANILPGFLRVNWFLHMVGKLFLMSKEERKARIRELDRILDLPGKRKTIARLSQGNKRKLLIAQSLMSHPDVLLLDEPTVYLDLLVKHNFYNYLRELKSRGVTIIISSHVLSEIEKLADRIFVFKDGGIKEELRVDALVQNRNWEYDVVQKIV